MTFVTCGENMTHEACNMREMTAREKPLAPKVYQMWYVEKEIKLIKVIGQVCLALIA